MQRYSFYLNHVHFCILKNVFTYYIVTCLTRIRTKNRSKAFFIKDNHLSTRSGYNSYGYSKYKPQMGIYKPFVLISLTVTNLKWFSETHWCIVILTDPRSCGFIIVKLEDECKIIPDLILFAVFRHKIKNKLMLVQIEEHVEHDDDVFRTPLVQSASSKIISKIVSQNARIVL